MAHKELVLALGMLVAASPLPASQSDPYATPAMAAPAGTPDTKYCLRVEPVTGSRLQTLRCSTRSEWARLEIDVDQEWAQNGVKVIG